MESKNFWSERPLRRAYCLFPAPEEIGPFGAVFPAEAALVPVLVKKKREAVVSSLSGTRPHSQVPLSERVGCRDQGRL